MNKVWRQSSIISTMIAQFIADNTGINSIDDGTIATLESNFTLAIQAVTKIKILGPLNMFVATTGNDANNGLSAAASFRNIQSCINAAFHSFDFNGFPLTINISPGTYSEAIMVSGLPLGCSAITIAGNGGQPTITTASGNTLTSTLGAVVNVTSLNLVNTAASSSCILSTQAASTTVRTGCIFNGSNSTGAHLSAQQTGTITITASYTGTGSCLAHLSTSFGVIFYTAGISVTLTNTPTFGVAFATAIYAGGIYCPAANFPAANACIGPKYNISMNGWIDGGLRGVNLFPGSIAGNTATGGQYQ